MAITQVITIFIIMTIPIPFAAVQPWVWSIYSLGMIAAYLLALWTSKDPSLLNVRSVTKPLLIFFAWTLFLSLPSPPWLIAVLSPVRSTTLASAWSLTGSDPAWDTIGYTQRNSLAWWIFLLSLGLFFLVVRDLCRDRKILKRIVLIMTLVGIAEAIYGLIQSLVPSMGVLWVDYVQAYLGTARGTFINRNNFAGFVEMIWPLALGATLSMTSRINSIKAALGSDRLNRQAIMALGIIVFLLALILTRSRAGIVSGLIGFVTFSFTARAGIKKVSRPTRILLGGTIVLLCLYTLTIGIGPVIDRFMAISEAGSSRLDIWLDSLPMIKDHPLGIGLRNYEDVFAIYNHASTPDMTVVYAHNDYLQLLIESGWVGFFSLAGGFIIFLVKSARSIKRIAFQKDPLRFYLAVGAYSGLISISVHSLFDFNLQIPANCLYFVVLMAVLSACSVPSEPPAIPDAANEQSGTKQPHRPPTSHRGNPI